MNEKTLSLRELVLHIREHYGRDIHPDTAWRWMTKGCRGRKLDSLMIGGIRVTTPQRVKEFFRVK